MLFMILSLSIAGLCKFNYFVNNMRDFMILSEKSLSRITLLTEESPTDGLNLTFLSSFVFSSTYN